MKKFQAVAFKRSGRKTKIKVRGTATYDEITAEADAEKLQLSHPNYEVKVLTISK